MYQPQVPLIPMSPAFRAVKLAALELGRLVLLRGADLPGGAGVGVRADALSAQGDLIEGVLRLSAPARFERRALDEQILAIDVDYLLESDAGSAALRPPGSGDLVLGLRRPAAAIYVAEVWRGAAGLLDIASAVIRPYANSPEPLQLVLGWRLVERDQRTRILFERNVPEPLAPARPRLVYGEDCD